MGKIKYLTQTQLKERGWTEGLIKRFLPRPSKRKENPNYKSGPPMCLYSLR
jgi:hypothetical protein